ncbi:hypothetical protein K6V98_08370, partial [Collinsella sp. AGMB00827]
MAIQMRRGEYSRFAPSRLLPGEWAVVQQDDETAKDGKAVYVAFSAGDVKRMATLEDMHDDCLTQIEAATKEISANLSRQVVATDNSIKEAEAARVVAERGRTTAESGRVSAETARDEAEKVRVASETARIASDSARDVAQEKNNADQKLNNERMLSLQPHICTTGEYNKSTRFPTISNPNGSQLYLVPISDSGGSSDDGNAYVEWRYIAGRWEKLGVSNVETPSITTDEIDEALSEDGSGTSGVSVLNLTGVRYLWTKIKAVIEKVDTSHHQFRSMLIDSINKKANKVHTHDTATSRADGFMSSYDKRKLDDIDANANNYTLPQA